MENNFFEKIVKNLKDEAVILNVKLEQYRTCENMNLYISTLKSLRETLDLISKYDWQLMYSEYEVEIDDPLVNLPNGTSVYNNPRKRVKEIAVWEQNHEGQIRNHKVWRVSDR